MYELMFIDADTPVFRAAKSVEEDYIIVTHKATGREKRYRNQTEWWGHWKKKEGGELAKINAERAQKDLEPFSPEDFEIEAKVELSTEIDNHVEYAVEIFDRFIGWIKRLEFAEDYRLGIGGGGNFRYDLAQQLPYKGNRGEKPLLFAEVQEAICRKYRTKVFRSKDEEIDDVLAQKGWENYIHYRKTGQWKWLLSYIDKDLKQIISPYFNYHDTEPEIIIPTDLDSAVFFATQCLTGDVSTDNILGLPNFTDDIRDKYHLRKAKGIGEATANEYMKGVETPKEAFERVVEAYKSYYGTERKPFETWRGDIVQWNWLDYLQDNAQLLWLRREPNEAYDIRDTLDRLGIEYG